MKGARKQLDHDPTREVEWHRPDDRFVPVRACEMVAALADAAERFGLSAAQIDAVADGLHDIIVQEAACFQKELGDGYAAFNPDRDTQPLTPLMQARTPEAYANLDAQLAYLLDKANFQPLSHIEVDEAIRTANAYGLRIRLNPERIEQLNVWVRGRGTVERVLRSWRHPIRGVPVQRPVYRRLAVVARLHDDPHVIVKLFKEIPEEDVEALLPHAEVDMGWRDRLIVFGGGAGALGSSVGKIWAIITGVAALSQFLWVLIAGMFAMAFRTFMGYRRARRNRDSQRTQHLYFQNLGNNSSAIQTLITTVAQEELKEAILAYAFCHDVKSPPAEASELDRRIEAFIRERFFVHVDFDAADALETLTRLELLAARKPLRVVAPDDAVRTLREHWQTRRTEHYHRQRIATRAHVSTSASGSKT